MNCKLKMRYFITNRDENGVDKTIGMVWDDENKVKMFTSTGEKIYLGCDLIIRDVHDGNVKLGTIDMRSFIMNSILDITKN